MDMTEPKRPNKVFLCHAHSDKDTVKALYDRLTKDGVDAWLDKEKLLPGQDWELEIRKAVREADVVVVCLSKQFNQAGFRQKEVRLALETAMEQLEGDIFIIPARLEECDVPERLQRYHWVDLFADDGYEKLMQSIRLRDNQLEKTHNEKEEAVKRRLPYFQTSDARNNNEQQNVRNSHENVPLYESANSNVARSKRLKRTRKPNTAIIVAVIGAVATLIAGLLSSPLMERWFFPAETPIATNTVTVMPEIDFTPTSKPLPNEITVSGRGSMLLIPAGKFTMGNNNGAEDEKPAHKVYLDAYYIDKFEITNAMYKDCVEDGACRNPSREGSNTRASYYGDPEFDQFPVIYVDWSMASSYCVWRSARLPTEAEWEKAARGTDERAFPWGEGNHCGLSNYASCERDTTFVGSYPMGISPYGVYDMAGNVWEWVQDWYAEDYYSSLSDSVMNPEGPSSGEKRVMRGGSWFNNESFVTSMSMRWKDLATIATDELGFRCARDATP